MYKYISNIYIYIYSYINHIYIIIYTYTYTHRYTHTYIHTHIRTYVHTYIHTFHYITLQYIAYMYVYCIMGMYIIYIHTGELFPES